MRASRICVALASLTLGLAATSANAFGATVTVSPAASCYVTGQSVMINATGFTPEGLTSVTLGPEFLASEPADVSGSWTAPLTFGTITRVADQRLVVSDTADPTLAGSATLHVSPVQVTVRPPQAGAGTVRLITATGFIGGDRLYAHVVGRHVVRTVLIGRLHLPCGSLRAHARVMLRGTPPGTYTVQFDRSRKFSQHTSLRVRFQVRVFRATAVTNVANALAHRLATTTQTWTRV